MLKSVSYSSILFRSVPSGITYILNIKIQFLVAKLGTELGQVGLVYVRLAEDVLFGEDFLFCAIGQDLTVCHDDDALEVLGDKIHVVEDGNNGSSFTA